MSILPKTMPITKLDDNLFIGSIEDACNFRKLKGNHITHILNVSTEIPNFFTNSFIYKKIHARDSPDFRLCDYFNEMADFIHEGTIKGRVLVHCFSGISRSTAAVMVYYVKHKQQDLCTTFNFIKHKRWAVHPNQGFVRQLKEYQVANLKPECQKKITNDAKNDTNRKSQQLPCAYKIIHKPLEEVKKGQQSLSLPKICALSRSSLSPIDNSLLRIEIDGHKKRNKRRSLY